MIKILSSLTKPANSLCFLIAAAILLSSCTTTTTSSSPRSLDSATSEKKRPIKKKAKSLFKKKPGNARADFTKDRAAGRIKLKQYGAPGPVTPYYNRILKDDLGIGTEVISDGLIETDMLRYAKEYNALMTAEIEQTYGPGILQKAFYRARIIEQQVRNAGQQQ